MISKSLRSVAADSNVILSAVIGKSALRVFSETGLHVVTTEFNIDEVKEYLPVLAEKYGVPELVASTQLLVLPLDVQPESEYGYHLKRAREYLADRDEDDIHLAALALMLEIPVWSNDKDLHILPVDVYSTARLLKKLGM